MKPGSGAWGVGQESFPCGIVETSVQVSAGVENFASGIVVELDPQTVELNRFEKGEHELVFFAEGTLRSTSDDIVSSRLLNEGS